MAFKDIFFKPEEDSASNVSSQKSVSESSKQSQTSTSSTPSYAALKVDNITPNLSASSTTNISDVNDDIVRTIFNVLIEKNTPVPDYIEVKNSAAALESMGLSEDKRYEAAFKMLKTSYPDFTKEKLLSSIDTYIGFVQQELADGQQECQQKRAAQIGDKQTRIKQLNEHAQEILAEIEKLQKEHQSVLESVSKLESEVAESTKTIDREEQVFINSVNVVINNLNNDKTVMSNLNI